jgi:hypothetical protein
MRGIMVRVQHICNTGWRIRTQSGFFFPIGSGTSIPSYFALRMTTRSRRSWSIRSIPESRVLIEHGCRR